MMFNRLDQAKSLTSNQLKIIAAAIIGDMLEFFDYFLIGFVLAFIIKPWNLTFGQSAVILLSSGIGAILGAAIWGRIADLFGRRKVFMATVTEMGGHDGESSQNAVLGLAGSIASILIAFSGDTTKNGPPVWLLPFSVQSV